MTKIMLFRNGPLDGEELDVPTDDSGHPFPFYEGPDDGNDESSIYQLHDEGDGLFYVYTP